MCNPWRFSFDRCTGRLFLGDVGEARWEEINLIVKSGNYGWNILEGSHCFQPPEGCDRTDLEPSIAEYPHNFEEGGFAVIRGIGPKMPDFPIPSEGRAGLHFAVVPLLSQLIAIRRAS